MNKNKPVGVISIPEALHLNAPRLTKEELENRKRILDELADKGKLIDALMWGDEVTDE